MGIERIYYLNKLISKKENKLIKIVTGIRRSGKSYLLDPIYQNYLLDNGVDEIQKVDNFESVLNSFLRKSNLDVYVTGSNSKFLSSDIITEFRRRGDEIRGLDEYLNFGGLPFVVTLKTIDEKIDYLNFQKNNV